MKVFSASWSCTTVQFAVALIAVVSAHAGHAAAPFSSKELLQPHDEATEFGTEVAISGNTIAALDLVNEFSCTDSGCPYVLHVYQKVNSIWTEVAELAFSAKQDSYTRNPVIAISPSEQFISVTGFDRVYVYQQPAGGWQDTDVPTATLTMPASLDGSSAQYLTMDDNSIAVDYCPAYYDYGGLCTVLVYDEPAGGWGSATPNRSAMTGAHGSFLAATPGSVMVANFGGSVSVFTEAVGGWADSASPSISTVSGGTSLTTNPISFAGADLAALGSATTVPSIRMYQQSGADWTTSNLLGILTAGTHETSESIMAAGAGVVVLGQRRPSASADADQLYVYEEPVTGWTSAGATQMLTVLNAGSPNTYHGGIDALAASPTAIVAGVSATCDPNDDGNFIPCSTVAVFDSTIQNSSDVVPVIATSTGEEGVAKGKPFQVQVTIKNYDATTDSSDVRLSWPILPQLSVTAAKVSQGHCTTGGGQLSCDLGVIAAGQSATLTVTMTAPKSIMSLVQTMQITCANDRVRRDNSPSLSIRSDSQPVAKDLSIAGVGTASGTFSATDADGNPLTYRVVTQPQFGYLTINGKAFTYTRYLGSPEFDSFTYVANDGYMDSAPAKVSTDVPADKGPSGGGNVNLASNAGGFGVFLDLGLIGLVAYRRRRNRSTRS